MATLNELKVFILRKKNNSLLFCFTFIIISFVIESLKMIIVDYVYQIKEAKAKSNRVFNSAG